MANALMLKWEADAKRRGINRLLDNATSSEPGATGPVYSQPDQGPGGTSDFKTAATNFGDYNASLAAQPGKTTGDQVNEIKAGMKAEGRDRPNTTELLKLAALVPLEMVQQAINATIMGATAPKRAMTGEMQMTDPATGHSSEDAIQSGLALTGLMSSGSFAGAPEAALGSGPVWNKKLYHGVTKDEPTGELRGPAYMAFDKDLAKTYAEDGGKGTVLERETSLENPLILDTPEKVKQAWDDSGALKTPGKFYPDAQHALNKWAQDKGHDGIVVHPDAFEGEAGFEHAAGTFGEPQVVVFDPTKAFKPPFDLVKTLDEADKTLTGDAADAVSGFVGHQPGAKSDPYASGIMAAHKLEAIARGEHPEAAAELEKAFAPVREQLKSNYGDEVTLYRVQEPVKAEPNVIKGSVPNDGTRAALSWTSDRKFAEAYAGVRRIKPPIADDAISALEEEFKRNGSVKIPSTSYTLKNEDGAVQIYDPQVGGHVTDTDSVRSFITDINDQRAEAIAENEKIIGKIVEAKVPLDDVMWATDRAGQSEFIVRNSPAGRVYIDGTGKVVQANSGSKEAALLADKASQPALYSHAARVVDSLPTTKAPASQWLATLKNKGVKDEELEALNLPTGNEPLTKDQIKAHIDANTPQLDEVVKGGQQVHGDGELDVQMTDRVTDEIAEEYRREHPNAPDHEVDEYLESDSTTDRIWEETQNRLDALEEENEGAVTGGGVKYSQYQLPGGENYREVLVTTPSKEGMTAAETAELKDLKAKAENFDFSSSDGYKAYRAYLDANPADGARYRELLNKQSQAATDPSKYRSSHWDEPNVLGHMRMNDRNVDGAKTLHAEEFQSDWHQQGKKNGYTTDLNKPLTATEKADLDKWSRMPLAEREAQGVQTRFVELMDRQDGEYSSDFGQRVPDAPFKKSWPDLLFKKFVRRAVDEGYDAISWTDGATQADRYDLSKHFDGIEWSSDPKTGEYAIAGMKDGKAIYTKSRVPKDQLPEVIGKDAADKIIESGKPVGGLEGLDLKVGGEGMKAFYDQELPRRAKKILGVAPEKKKLGPSKDAPELATQDETDEFDGRVAMAMEDWHDAHPNATDDEIEAAEDAFADKFMHSGGTTVHFVRLTPEIKERVKKGFPLFSTGVPLPTTSDDQNTQRVIRLIRVPHDPFSGEKK